MGDIYRAKNGFATTHKDQKIIVYQGDTTEAGHWLLSSNPDSFELVPVKYPAPAAKKPAVV